MIVVPDCGKDWYLVGEPSATGDSSLKWQGAKAGGRAGAKLDVVGRTVNEGRKMPSKPKAAEGVWEQIQGWRKGSLESQVVGLLGGWKY